MGRVFGIFQGVGIVLLLVTAGASDAGRLTLGATAAWVMAGALLVAAGTLGRPALARLRRHSIAARPAMGRDDKVTAFPPIDAA